MKIKRTQILLSTLLFLAALGLSGCGFTSFIMHPFGGHKSSLKKRLIIMPIIDQANLGGQVTRELFTTLAGRLEASGKVVVFESHETIFVGGEHTDLPYGVNPDLKFLANARQRGMNAVLTGIITPIEKEERLRGIWPLRRAVARYSIAFILNLIDPQDGTVIMSHLEADGVDIDLEEEEFTDKNWILAQLREKILPRIMKRSIKPIRQALESEPWEGRILKVNHQIQINAGADVGVKPGYRFEVYGGRETVTAKGGRQFLVSWKRIGEIRVTEVHNTTALAEPIKGKGFKAGQKIVSLD